MLSNSRTVAFAMLFVCLASAAHAGGTLDFGSSRVKTSATATGDGIPVDLVLDADSPLAALQFSVVASGPSVRLLQAFRGTVIEDAAKWGCASNVRHGVAGQGDTLIVVVWSRTLSSLPAGVMNGIVRIAYRMENAVQVGASVTFSLVGVVAALADGKSSPGLVVTGTSREVQIQIDPPSAFALAQNYPNPFNPSTRVQFTLPQSGQVDIRVYDLIGRMVAEPQHGYLEAGTHTVDVDGSSLAAGTYVLRVRGEGIDGTMKMVLVR
jgi:hypothetical protein